MAYGAAWETEHGTTLNWDQRACCLHRAAGGFWVPLSISSQQNHCVTGSHRKIHKAPAPKSRQSQSQETDGKTKTNLFSVSLYFKRWELSFSLSLLFSNLSCSEWPKPWGKCACWKWIYQKLMVRERGACWGWDEGCGFDVLRGKAVRISAECSWTSFSVLGEPIRGEKRGEVPVRANYKK